jgi:hypothetical protein
MGTTKSYEVWKAEFINDMGEELGELMAFFWSEFAHLNRSWRTYLSIYNSNTNLKIVNDQCPTFFWHYQQMFREHFVISIVRLTEDNRKGQASLHKLKELIDNESCKELVVERLQELKNSTKDLSFTRNNYYAHYSYKKKVLSKAHKLRGTTKDDIEEVLKKMSEIINVVMMHYMKSSTPFFELEEGYGAYGLVAIIAQAQLFEKLNYNRKLNKEITPDMWDWRSLLR